MNSKNKIYFASISCALFLSITQVSLSSKTQGETDFQGNWSKTYTLIDGSTIIHAPDSVSLKNSGLNICSGKGLSLSKGSVMGTLVPKKDLKLSTNSSMAQFEKALIDAGVLKPAAPKPTAVKNAKKPSAKTATKKTAHK